MQSVDDLLRKNLERTMSNTNNEQFHGGEVMMQVEEQLLPTAFARAVNVDSTINYMGEVITLLAKGNETNGRFAFMEVKVRPGTEPPPHIHEREHELFFAGGWLESKC